MIVSRKTSFDAAHFLPGYKGPCQNLHGHHWEAEIGIRGEVDPETGMVIDFTFLDDFLKENVVDVLDHHLINDILSHPTAENIANWIQDQWKISHPTLKMYSSTSGRSVLFDFCPLDFVRVWETQDSMVELRA